MVASVVDSACTLQKRISSNLWFSAELAVSDTGLNPSQAVVGPSAAPIIRLTCKNCLKKKAQKFVYWIGSWYWLKFAIQYCNIQLSLHIVQL